MIFASDARGYDPVVLDILFVNDREERLNAVAHEFHHWSRAKRALEFIASLEARYGS